MDLLSRCRTLFPLGRGISKGDTVFQPPVPVLCNIGASMLATHHLNVFIRARDTYETPMKIYISADIEGIAGITHWDEANKTESVYQEFRVEMTNEVIAACRGAITAGATDILIKDAHGSGRNILTADLPACVRLIRGWSGHPLGMLQELDDSFRAILMIGYHSKAGSSANPLAHTLTGDVREILINGEQTSEFRLHANVAALYGVPVVFVSGDEGLCEDIQSINANIHTLGVSRGVGPSTISLAPVEARHLICEGVESALTTNLADCLLPLPENFVVEVSYREPTSAYGAGFYPDAKQIGPHTIHFETTHFFEVMRLLAFTT
jgi:D-amino peptidase